ncbi:MAG: RNA polymerase sigma factor RpoD/SigA [candidate division KSB1 bacterium]|nr:RNA polymerase sigma factor RpoD/SigA [candidate division KSB1 bacterium]MDZ7385816.1 RNA polymerase sigma factor RpoD/SigA [candidate division KSB1 bacterium]MDZ7392709.1 RNA polymerase sigma factor RpoD/SigA [candidate division KSB1 bacterium]
MPSPRKLRMGGEAHSLERYLREIGQEPLLSPNEEVELARRAREGDSAALERLTRANLRFVVSVAKQFQNQGLSLGDLINEGNLGLIKAATRFDETRGFKFISYAVWWIRQSILQALAEQSRIVRLPLNRVGALMRIGKTFSLLEQQFEREPTAQEVAGVLELNPLDVTDVLQLGAPHVSLTAPFFPDEEGSLEDVIASHDIPAPDSPLMAQSLREEIQAALNALSPREAEVIRLYYGFDQERALTLEEIGARLGLTRERVRQIKEKALRRLRRLAKGRGLRSYLG